MIHAKIKMEAIDYEKTLSNLFPTLRERVRETQSDRMLVRLFQKLDQDALPLLLGFMTRMGEKEKNELLCTCINFYAPDLTNKLNEYLQTDRWGRNFGVGDVSIRYRGDAVILLLQRLKVDYEGLLDDEQVQQQMSVMAQKSFGKLGGIIGEAAKLNVAKKIEKFAVKSAPMTIERKGIDLLSDQRWKKKLIQLAEDALKQRGLIMKLGDFQLEQAEGDSEVGSREVTVFSMSPELEEALLDALAGSLRTMLSAAN